MYHKNCFASSQKPGSLIRYTKTTSVFHLSSVTDCTGFPIRRAIFVKISSVTTKFYLGEKNKLCHSLYIFHVIQGGGGIGTENIHKTLSSEGMFLKNLNTKTHTLRTKF